MMKRNVLLNSVGGKISYTDDITFSSSKLLNKYGNLYSDEQDLFIKENFS